MSNYRTIVCCTDFSANAEQALAEATYLAGLSGARLYVAHVIHGGEGETALAVPVAQRAEQEASVRSKLESIVGEPSGYQVTSVVRRGDVVEEIHDITREVRADLVVIGARGIGWWEGLVTGGSVAKRLVRAADVPILVVSHTAPNRVASSAPVQTVEDLPLPVLEVDEAQASERKAEDA
ncbi:MAG: universal stress protein [Thermoleophilia bacterium]